VSPLHAVVLGITEGITEYLPVSSTGHLILVGRLLGLEGDADKAFEIVIQLGALLAVVVHYRRLLAQRVVGLVRREPAALRLLGALIAGFVPTAIVGLLVGKLVKRHLFAPVPVACALAVGGLLMIAVERGLQRRGPAPRTTLDEVSARDGLFVGLLQCLSLVPGTSRSMCTILGGRLRGLSAAVAAELSFLLALPTLGAATVYEGWKERAGLATLGALPLAIGMVVSFLVAWAVIAGFLRYLARGGLQPFGVYRLLVAAVVLAVGF
jgi:undecaprenyl-diphosphatase